MGERENVTVLILTSGDNQAHSKTFCFKRFIQVFFSFEDIGFFGPVFVIEIIIIKFFL